MALFGSTPAAATSTTGDTSKDVAISQAQGLPDDSISDISFSPVGDYLAVSSWDGAVRIYEVNQNGVALKLAFQCKQDQNVEYPLCVAWSLDGTKLAAGGIAGTIYYLDLTTVSGGPEIKPSATWLHSPQDSERKGVKGIRWCQISGQQYLVTGSWDKTIKYWNVAEQDTSTGGPKMIGAVQCQERVYSMDAKNTLLVIATAERHIHIINLNEPLKIYKTIQSPLKWQTRVVSCFADASGFAVGSIEGRCAIQYVEEKDTSLNFSFKCHRQQDPSNRDVAKVYSVNAISFHPQHGTFSTAGSDGTFHFWDKDAKHRLKGYPEVGGSITATAFNRDGSIFAYAVSYDWSKGYTANSPDQKIMLKLHPVVGDECKPRPGTKKR